MSVSKKLYLGLFVAAILCACTSRDRYFPRQIETVTVDVLRFDSAFLSVDAMADDYHDQVVGLYDDFSDFMPVFTDEIIGIPASDTAAVETALQMYLTDTTYGFSQTNSRVKQLFADISPIRSSLNHAFSRYHYLYPEQQLPEITFMVSGFNASLFFWEAENDYLRDGMIRIAVGTDMYLGSDYEWYNQVVYNYQKQTMRPECLAVDVVSAFLFHTIAYTSSQSRLLDNMIYRGKIMYLLSLLFPDESAYEIMGYTKEQWDWAVRNESAIWHLMMDKRDLFKTESLVLSSYLNDGPFTAEVSQSAPPRLGTWVGWRIAENYMKHNKTVSLQELMAEGDAQKILGNSYYKP